ncbi:MAG: aminomethyl-transferring glycine dehydrogenase [Candidatus Margulisiibacteriota bacterium]
MIPFSSRHIGPDAAEQAVMLSALGVSSLDELITQTVPNDIRLNHPLNLHHPETEASMLKKLHQIAAQNKQTLTVIGQGYYGTHTPSVILRNVLENPGWYTQYTPYQAEISQGRLEALLNFQTMVSDLTGLPVANASLLDEGTAAAEAMTVFWRSKPKSKSGATHFFVSETCFEQTKAVLQGRAEPLGITLVVGNPNTFVPDASFFGALIQYPDATGDCQDWQAWTSRCHEAEIFVAVATDLMALALLTPPGEWGADIAFGNSQRFGVPLGFGGPHAAFFAVKETFQRQIPGRIIGLSKDRFGNPAYRMALQTREQHIRREKATSNICTAQALLAIMAGMYAVYHGPVGIKAIASAIHERARAVAAVAQGLGYIRVNTHAFDTVTLELASQPQRLARLQALQGPMGITLGQAGTRIWISVDETTDEADLAALESILTRATDTSKTPTDLPTLLPTALARTSAFLTHPAFTSHHSETEMMRYIKNLERKDLSLTSAMIPLGSCTMKLNAATELLPLSWPAFSTLHPFVPAALAGGYHTLIRELEQALGAITGLPGVSLQPNSGAQGEYAGLMVIRAYHRHHGQPERTVVLIPASAHGTNPASAALAGMDIVVVACLEHGDVDMADLDAKIAQHRSRLAALMITYPSTHGVFEPGIQSICKRIHDAGGLVYMDGANMNAQVGLTSPASIGADVCHLNLHKTFAIPHGGGGPGMGPICVRADLTPFLPSHPFADTNETGVAPVSAAPWGSASILLISYVYISLMGSEGLTLATQTAILNANYIKTRLEAHYPVLFVGEQGRVAHELILDFRDLKKQSGIDVEDVAKRLMDYGFHAPTMSFPVAGTLMIEPTESESLAEIDRFCAAMIAIRAEIQAVIDAPATRDTCPLKMAPHPTTDLLNWTHPYTQAQAFFPLGTLADKFWPSVGRIDNAHGDRNLICTCPPVSAYTA